MKRTVFNRELMYSFLQKEGRRFNLLPEPGRIECPTLLMAGEDDPVCPIGDAQEIAACIAPNLLQFECFEHAGHGVFRGSPARALQVVREFISS